MVGLIDKAEIFFLMSRYITKYRSLFQYRINYSKIYDNYFVNSPNSMMIPINNY